jgi:hypothetical protein
MLRFVPWFASLCICVTVLFSFPARLLSQNQNPGLETAKILEVHAHPEGRAVNYVNDTPARVYDGYPFYDIEVQLGGECYVARFESQTGYYPANWKPSSTVQARMDSGQIYLLRYDGAEVPTSIVGRCQS